MVPSKTMYFYLPSPVRTSPRETSFHSYTQATLATLWGTVSGPCIVILGVHNRIFTKNPFLGTSQMEYSALCNVKTAQKEGPAPLLDKRWPAS